MRPAPTGQDLELATRLDQALTRMVRWSRREVAEPLGPGVLSALACVVDRGPIRLGDLAAHERVAPPTLSRMVAGLEQDGHLTRDVDPADRRSSFVRATDAGRDLVVGLRARRGAMLAERLEPVLDVDRRAALASLVDALERAFASDAP